MDKLNSISKRKTNNPNGRPKGTPNKITQDMRMWLSSVLDKNRHQMERDLKSLEPKERLFELLKWLKQGYAESKTIEAWCSDGENTLRPPSEMTEDEIIAEIEKIRAARDV